MEEIKKKKLITLFSGIIACFSLGACGYEESKSDFEVSTNFFIKMAIKKRSLKPTNLKLIQKYMFVLILQSLKMLKLKKLVLL